MESICCTWGCIPMYNDTITLFNRKEGEAGDTWYPSVLHNVQLNINRASIMTKDGAQSQDSAVLNIRYTVDAEGKKVGGKRWLPPNEWQALADPAQALTFNSGSKFDFFCFGDWGSEAPVKDADYTADMDFYTYMNRTRDHVFAVSSVGGPYSVIPHFEIMGK